MKLKLDENGHVVLENGMPVYIHDDGKEIAFDAPAAMKKIGELNNESAGHRIKAKEATDALAVFGDLDPKAAREAIATVANLDAKKLLDAGEVETIRKEMGATFAAEKDAIQVKLDDAQKQVRKLAIGGMFSRSKYLAEKTVLSAAIAEVVLGPFFETTEKDGVIMVQGRLNAIPIFSRTKPGELADFDEALSVIIDQRADKADILRGASGGGSGGSGGDGTGGGGNNPFKTGNVTEQGALILQDKALASRMATEAGKVIPGLNAPA